MPKGAEMWRVSFALIIALSGCGEKGVPDDQVFTLYQNAPSTPSARVGIATFDMKWGDTEQMNHMKCNDIAELLQADWKFKTRDKPDLPEVKNFKYWCEKGRYRN